MGRLGGEEGGGREAKEGGRGEEGESSGQSAGAGSADFGYQARRSLSGKASTQMANALGLDPSIAQAGNIVSEVNAEVSGEQGSAAPRPVRSGPKVGRNDPCPCGNGKKYKKCHMEQDRAAGGPPAEASAP